MPRNIECQFCDENDVRQNTFYGDELFRARWALSPESPGHAQVLPIRHRERRLDMTEEENARMMRFINTVFDVVQETNLHLLYSRLFSEHHNDPEARRDLGEMMRRTKAGLWVPLDSTMRQNDGPSAGQSVPHISTDIIPRY